MLSNTLVAALAVAASSAFAQTFTDCNPLNGTCPADTALGTSASWNWTTATLDTTSWNQTVGTTQFTSAGANFTIAQKGDVPTLKSNFYLMFGRVSVVMQAATGQGIVSSIVMESDDLDEIDWEMIGGNGTFVETNFFGKKNTTDYDRAVWFPIDSIFSFHNYTTVWTADKIDWYIDDNLVRTLNANDSLANYGKNYPQTPMYIQMNNWAGGDPTENLNGTVEWAGGVVDYSKGPFTMTVQSVEVEDFSSGSSYTYSDTSGSWQSITIAPGNSTIKDYLTHPHGVEGHYNVLPQWAKIAIAVGSVSVFAILMALMTFCCIRQRRAGRRERQIADAAWERDLSELGTYKRMHISEEEIHPRTAVQNKMGGYR